MKRSKPTYLSVDKVGPLQSDKDNYYYLNTTKCKLLKINVCIEVLFGTHTNPAASAYMILLSMRTIR